MSKTYVRYLGPKNFKLTFSGAYAYLVAMKKLEHFQKHHRVDPLWDGYSWCDRCALVFGEKSHA